MHTRFVCALQEFVSPVLCKYWWFYGGINGDPLQEGSCHTQAYCTQSPCPCSSPLLTCTSTGDAQQSSVSVSVVSLCTGAHKVCLSPLSVSGRYQGFPGGSEVKASACNEGDLGSIPGLGRSPGEGKGYPFQYSGLENSMDYI